jgi:hypothetical protein
MEMKRNYKFQNLNWAHPFVKKKFRKNPNSSISAIYRKLRGDSHLSLIGDYPIFSLILSEITSLGIKPKPTILRYALKQSNELKGKSLILKALLKGLLIANFYVDLGVAVISSQNQPSAHVSVRKTLQ